MGTLFADPRIEALYRRLFDTPERRAMLAELLGALVAEAPPPRAPAAGAWDGRTIGRGERLTPAQMNDRQWWSDASLVWAAAASASSSYGSGWSPSVAVGPPTVFPRHGDIQGAWAPRERAGGVQWLELTFPDDAPSAVGLRVFETHQPGAVFAITDAESEGDAAKLWQAEPVTGAHEARVLDVTLDAPRALRRVRLWLDTNVSDGWNEIDTVALVAERPAQAGPVDWRSPAPTRAPRKPSRGKNAVPPPDASAAPVGEGERLDAAAGKKLLRGSQAWRWPTQASASSTYGGGWSPSAVVGPPTVFPRHGDISGAWAPSGVGLGPQWLLVTFADDTAPVDSVLVFETHRPGALYAVVAVDDGGRAETLWQRDATGSLPHAATVLSVKLREPRPIKALRLWVDTDVVESWPEIDAVALVPWRVTTETCAV